MEGINMASESELLDDFSKKLSHPLHKKILEDFQKNLDSSKIIEGLVGKIQAECDAIKKS